MDQVKFARIGVKLAEEDSYAATFREFLMHSGLIVTWITDSIETHLMKLDMLILAGDGSVPKQIRPHLEQWIQRGGQLICVASTWDMEDVLSVLAFENAPLGAGTIDSPGDQLQFWPDECHKLRFFGGVRAIEQLAQVLVRTSHSSIAVSKNEVGEGCAWLVGIDLGQSIFHMQNGRSIETHAIEPQDGSVFFRGPNLISEEATMLDWNEDRLSLDNRPPIFDQPIADQLGEFFFRIVLNCFTETNLTPALHWYWPDDANGAAVLGVDCDDLDGEQVFLLKQQFDISRVSVTWFVAAPGYPLDIFRMIGRWGDEVGLLFNSSTTQGWSEYALKSQYLVITRSSTTNNITSVRVKDGHWSGFQQFYENCFTAGARCVSSKGGRQAGSIGFTFGTCHPFFVQNPAFGPTKLLEIPYHIFEPGTFTTTKDMHALIRQCSLRNGCINVVLPSRFLDKENSVIGLKQVLVLIKEYRLKAMLPHEILHFQSIRRHLNCRLTLQTELEVMSEKSVKGLTLIIPGIGFSQMVRGKANYAQHTQRWGVQCSKIEFDLEPNYPHKLSFFRDLGSELAA